MPITNYYWDVDTDNVFLEEDENGNTIAEYTQEPSLYGELIAQERDGQASFYNFDGQGSTRELTDQNQNVTDTYTYDAFGVEIAKSGTTTNPFRYTGALGYYANPLTNDIYVRARVYQPAIGRWLSRDPIEFADDRHLYLYTSNNPTTYRDPSGLMKCSIALFQLSPQNRGCGYRLWNNEVSYGFYFSVQAVFNAPCVCCEYRQYFTCDSRSRFHLPGRVSSWEVELQYGEVVEDCPPPTNRCYGHRKDSGESHDTYSNNGCVYTMRDMPGKAAVDGYFKRPATSPNLRIEYELSCRFILNIIDTCCEAAGVVHSEVLDFQCKTFIDRAAINQFLRGIGRPPI